MHVANQLDVVRSELDALASAELIFLMVTTITITVKRRELFDSILFYQRSLFEVVNCDTDANFNSVYIYMLHEEEKKRLFLFFSMSVKYICHIAQE